MMDKLPKMLQPDEILLLATGLAAALLAVAMQWHNFERIELKSGGRRSTTSHSRTAFPSHHRCAMSPLTMRPLSCCVLWATS